MSSASSWKSGLREREGVDSAVTDRVTTLLHPWIRTGCCRPVGLLRCDWVFPAHIVGHVELAHHSGYGPVIRLEARLRCRAQRVVRPNPARRPRHARDVGYVTSRRLRIGDRSDGDGPRTGRYQRVVEGKSRYLRRSRVTKHSRISLMHSYNGAPGLTDARYRFFMRTTAFRSVVSMFWHRHRAPLEIL